jgi:hypothetical protein
MLTYSSHRVALIGIFGAFATLSCSGTPEGGGTAPPIGSDVGGSAASRGPIHAGGGAGGAELTRQTKSALSGPFQTFAWDSSMSQPTAMMKSQAGYCWLTEVYGTFPGGWSNAVFVTQDSNANWVLTGQAPAPGTSVGGQAACIPLGSLTSNPVRWWWDWWANQRNTQIPNLPAGTFCDIAGIWGYYSNGASSSFGLVRSGVGADTPAGLEWPLFTDEWLDGQCVFMNSSLAGGIVAYPPRGSQVQLGSGATNLVCALHTIATGSGGQFFGYIFQDSSGAWWSVSDANTTIEVSCFPVPQ